MASNMNFKTLHFSALSKSWKGDNYFSFQLNLGCPHKFSWNSYSISLFGKNSYLPNMWKVYVFVPKIFS